MTKLILTSCLLLLTSVGNAYDPCWAYPEYEKDNCYRQYQEQREEARDQAQRWEDQRRADAERRDKDFAAAQLDYQLQRQIDAQRDK